MLNISLGNFNKKPRIQNLDKRWGLMHLSYVVIYFFCIMFMLVNSHPIYMFFSRITDFLLLFVFINVAGTFFDQTYKFTLRYLVLPGFGLAWVVFAARLSFDVLHGLDWLNDFVSTHHSPSSLPTFLYNPYAFHAFDFVAHFLPLLIMYQLVYIYAEELEKEVMLIPLIARYFTLVLPYVLIFLWALVFDPFRIYLLHKSPVVLAVMYLGIPALLMFIYGHFYKILLPQTFFQKMLNLIPREEQVSSLLELGTLLILIMNVMLGAYLIGWHSMYRSILCITSFCVILLLIVRLINFNKMHITALVMLPLLSFMIGVAIVRELIFIMNDGSHAKWLHALTASQNHILPYDIILFLYSIYLFVNYVIVIPFVGELFFRRLPYSLNRISPVRVYLRKTRARLKYKWIFDIWHKYGCVFMVAIYLILNRIDPPSYGVNLGYKQWEVELTYCVAFILICVLFSAPIYERQILEPVHQAKKKNHFLVWFSIASMMFRKAKKGYFSK